MVKEQNEKTWLKWNTVLKNIQHLKFEYSGTEEKDVIEDMITYIKILMKKLEEE